MHLISSPRRSGSIFIEDVTIAPPGTVTDKLPLDTGGTILQSCKVSGATLTLHLKASYPLIRIDSPVMAAPVDAELTQAASGGHYEGSQEITITGSGKVSAVVKTADEVYGGVDTIDITLAAPPEVSTAVFSGDYPGVQTELKEDDTMQLDIVSNGVNFNGVEVFAGAGLAGKSEVIPVVSGTSASISMSIANRGDTPQLLPGRIRLRDSVTGAFGPTFDTDSAGSTEKVHVLNLNDADMGPVEVSKEYAGGRTAAKDNETVIVTTSITDPAGTVVYSDPTGLDLIIPSPTTYENVKICTLDAPNRTNDSQTNFQLVTTRTANGKVATLNVQVVVHDEPATINVSIQGGATIQSGGNDGTSVVEKTVTISSNQALSAAPTLDAGAEGTFLGSWVGSGKTWTRVLQVHDDDTKGTYQFTNLLATNGAAIDQTVINTGEDYTFKGWISRTVNVPALSPVVNINVGVVDLADFSGVEIPQLGIPLVVVAIGTPPTSDPDKRGWITIDALGNDGPTEIQILHTGTVASNGSGDMQLAGLQESI